MTSHPLGVNCSSMNHIRGVVQQLKDNNLVDTAQLDLNHVGLCKRNAEELKKQNQDMKLQADVKKYF